MPITTHEVRTFDPNWLLFFSITQSNGEDTSSSFFFFYYDFRPKPRGRRGRRRRRRGTLLQLENFEHAGETFYTRIELIADCIQIIISIYTYILRVSRFLALEASVGSQFSHKLVTIFITIIRYTSSYSRYFFARSPFNYNPKSIFWIQRTMPPLIHLYTALSAATRRCIAIHNNT